VRFSVAPSFGALYIVPRLPELFRRYPGITVEVLASDRSADLVEDGIDVAIRTGELSESTLVAQKLCTTRVLVVASPAYLEENGEPAKPSDLEVHRCIVVSSQSGPRPWQFEGRSGRVTYLPEGSFRTNDGEQMRAAALAGLGVAQVPHWLVARELEEGSLRRILRKHEPSPAPISAVRLANRRLATKDSVFIEFLAEILGTMRDDP
jgi:LysR family transcriptional regulator for bpeEF and oprC